MDNFFLGEVRGQESAYTAITLLSTYCPLISDFSFLTSHF